MSSVTTDGAVGRKGGWRTALAVVACFAVVGTLVAGAVMLVAVIALDAMPAGAAGQPLSAFLFSCATCLPPVLAVGLLVAGCDAAARPVSALLASALGAACGVTWGLFLASTGALPTLSILAFVATVAATLVCWRLTRRLVPAS
jgi:hypothetical protein